MSEWYIDRFGHIQVLFLILISLFASDNNSNTTHLFGHYFELNPSDDNSNTALKPLLSVELCKA